MSKQYLLLESMKMGFSHDISEEIISTLNLNEDRAILMSILAQRYF
jgi:hypothetical protein